MDIQNNNVGQAQVVLPSQDLTKDMEFLSYIGFKLKNIFPDDDPQVAVMFGHGIEIRLDRASGVSAPTINILTDDPNGIAGGKKEITAPNGTVFNISPKTYEVVYPPIVPQFEVRRLADHEPWVIGRAGMLYRDLVPGRLGGGIMASHIRIPKGGPVGDVVHYHTIGFQLIFCYSGWVELVYEDQGPPFILRAGDCVTQPPEIRHRVLEASDNLEVIEIGVPAEHMTTIDHEMELPTADYRPGRLFDQQRFCHHKAETAVWDSTVIQGFEKSDTGVNDATNGLASVQVIRPLDITSVPPVMSHDTDIYFSFILQGKITLKADGHETQTLKKGDAYVIPKGLKYHWSGFTKDLEIMEVSLPGRYRITQY